jgi:hypothetical protein
MNPASKSWPASVAMSPAFRGHSIGRADSPDRSSRGHFAKKTFYFLKINPHSRGPLSIFCENNLRIFRNQPAVQIRWASGFFSNKTFPLSKNQLALQRPSPKFLRKPPQIFLKSTRNPPFIISFFSKKNKLAKTLKLHSKSQKNHKFENQADLKSSRVDLCSASIISHV